VLLGVTSCRAKTGNLEGWPGCSVSLKRSQLPSSTLASVRLGWFTCHPSSQTAFTKLSKGLRGSGVNRNSVMRFAKGVIKKSVCVFV
jgi:hypothetical protein